jgi:hypothetical protein
MKKKSLMIVGVLFFIILIFIIYRTLKKDVDVEILVTKSDYHRILIDSIKINNQDNIYLFKYNTGVFGYLGDFISIRKTSQEIDSSNSILKSDYILKIDTVKNDSIFIYLSNMDYQLLNASQKYKFILLKSKTYYDSKPNREPLMINLDKRPR